MTDQPEQLEAAIAEALGEGARAAELRAMRTVLEQRLTGLRGELTETHEPRTLRHRVKELELQIAALREEEIVAGFVEDTIQVAWSARRMSEG